MMGASSGRRRSPDVPTDMVEGVLVIPVIVSAAVGTFCAGSGGRRAQLPIRARWSSATRASRRVVWQVYEVEVAQAFQHISVCARASGRVTGSARATCAGSSRGSWSR